MQEIQLATGFLPFATEGKLAGGGIYDVRRPHVPENIGLFQFVGAGNGTYSKHPKGAAYNIFKNVGAGKGDYVLKPDSQVKGEAAYKLSSYAAKQGDYELGTWPSMSGLTISMGCDMGASYSQPQQVMDFFNQVATNSGDTSFVELGKKLSVAAGKRGIQAFEVTAPLRPQVQLTQQQVLDIQNTMWRKKKASTLNILKTGKVADTKGVALNEKAIYDPLIEILTKMTYANAYFTLAMAGFLDRHKAVGSKKPETKEEIIAQCDAFLLAMADYDKEKEKDYCKHSGFIAFTQELKKAAQNNQIVVITNTPLQINDILNPQNPVGDWMTAILRGAKDNPSLPHFRDKLEADMKKDGTLPPNKDGGNTNPPNNGDNGTNKDGQDGDAVSILELVQMAMAGKGTIKGSVGKGGDNHAQDVMVVKALLTFHGYYNFSFNPITFITQMVNLGTNDATLEAAITKFQTDKGSTKPDGRVDPNGKSLGWLNSPKGTKPNPQPNPNPQPADDTAIKLTAILQAAMGGKGTIKESVGKGGKNRLQDVMVVKGLLTYHGYLSFSFNPITLMQQVASLGQNNAELENAIIKFQTDKGFAKPDGRVDPDGKSLKLLNAAKGGNPTPNPNPQPQEEEELSFSTPGLDGTDFGCYH